MVVISSFSNQFRGSARGGAAPVNLVDSEWL